MTRFNILAAALAALLLLATLFDRNPLVQVAESYSKSIVTSSIAVYASLRAINAFLSTAQEVEVGASFIASGTAQPLKVLEPLDDTVERVASVVLSVTMVSGVMILGFTPVAGLGYALVLLGWVGGAFGPSRQIGHAALRLGLLMGVIVPLAFIVAGALGDLVTQGVLAKHEALLATLAQDISPSITEEAPQTAQSAGTNSVSNWLMAQLGGVLDTTAAVTSATTQTLGQLEDFGAAARMLVSRSDELLASYIQIIGAYVLKGVVLPLLLVGMAMVLARSSRPASS